MTTLPFRFDNLYAHGFARIAVATPQVRVADPAWNAEQSVNLMQQAADRGAVLALFPELGLSAYTCDDLFHQNALLDACEAALARVIEASKACPVTAVVGLPLRVAHRLFNVAAVVQGGQLLGVVPKSYLPNYAEFYEARQFNAGGTALATEVTVAGQTAPFGSRLLFQAANLPDFIFHIEICEDVWVPIPPSSFAALAGATVLLNLSASNITIGKSGYRHKLVGMQSARCLAAYAYSSAGNGESTTDLAWDGQSMVYENGDLLAESARFATEPQLITADVDVERMARERMRQGTFGDSVGRHRDELQRFRTVRFEAAVPLDRPLPLERALQRFPYVPADSRQRDERCAEVYHIQVQALVQRLAATKIPRLVIGISGGLDSTQALLVAARAMDLLGRPRTDILAYTMPGFATSERTLDQALRLMQAVGCSAQQIDIRPSCTQMLKDLGHPFADGQPVHDITFENVQAGERTSHLFRLANFHNAIVVGTGDLSELALGWCTYGVGDHMSHYNVNASVPKTLVKHLVRWVAEKGEIGVGPDRAAGSRVLIDILETEVSPELVPGTADAPQQSTEASVGPYELQDFHLFQILRHGFTPAKVAFLAQAAWGQKYPLAEIRKHLRNFLFRFFQTSQFKRSCVPNAPKVGSGGSLSPRGDWRAPSDSVATAWLADLERVPIGSEPNP